MNPEEIAREKIAEMLIASGRGIQDGKAEGITGRKPAEEALHESEERFRAIFELAAVGVAGMLGAAFTLRSRGFEDHFVIMQGFTRYYFVALCLGLPLVRVASFVAAARRVLNVEGYAVVRFDEPSDTIELNLELLIAQFELRSASGRPND